jgi:GTP-binding protein
VNITSAIFVRSVVGADPLLDDGTPHVAFIGRSNVGKSSIINNLTHQKNLAHTSGVPGRTQQLNIFLINKSLYLIDLPGYGYAKASREAQQTLHVLINWYLLNSPYKQKLVVLIIDSNVGLTNKDLSMLNSLESQKKNVVIVANKFDNVKKSSAQHELQKIQKSVGNYKVIPYSTLQNIGSAALLKEIFS